MTTQNSKQEHLGDLSRDFAVFFPVKFDYAFSYLIPTRVTLHFSNEGAMQVSVDSGLGKYQYIIPAQAQ